IIYHSVIFNVVTVLNYHFNEYNHFNKIRVLLTKDLLEKMGTLMDKDIVKPRKATDDELHLFHDPVYVEAVKKSGNNQWPFSRRIEFGLGSEDTPPFPDMHDAASWLVGGTLTAVDAVMENTYKHA